MKVYELGETLTEISFQDTFMNKAGTVYIICNEETEKLFDAIGMKMEGDIELHSIGFNKVEARQDCIVGSLYIPKLMDISGERYEMLFFINNSAIVFVDNEKFVYDLIERIILKKSNQGANKAMFLYNFFTEFLSRDLQVLGQYEKTLMKIEENIMEDKSGDYQGEIIGIRKKLLTLRGYYSEIADMGKELEDNEIGIFSKMELRYFGITSDRAERLAGKTAHLLEYAGQVKDAYQTQADTRQSANMQFLTIISTIFFPLTLITGWYGMNFRDMPELENGYPGVIVLSLCVVIVCIIVFKIKKIF